MDPARFTRVDPTTWRVEPHGAMRVPAVIYADENLIRDMDDKVFEQAVNVAALPGIVQASYAMPDAHWGYGFPIGGVAAFDPDRGGVVSAGGVGFDISCGVRTMLTGLSVSDILPVQKALAESLFRQIPAGVGSRGAITLDAIDMEAMLSDGARWAIERGWGQTRDLERIEEEGRMAGARPEWVSERAQERQRVISAQCARPSIARWQIARFSVTTPAAFLRISSRIAICAFCSMSPTIPARSNRMWSRESGANCSCIARALPGPLGPAMRACLRHCVVSVSQCLSAAAWGPAHTFSST
jgi:tRNA-splicing ligase RtcB